MLAVAAGLVDRRHDVRFLTGRRFEDRVTGTGTTFIGLPPETDFDDSALDEFFPGRAGLKGPKGIRYDLKEIFMRPGRAQYQTFFMDWPRAADHLVQFTVPEFEYPRSDLPASVHFVGPCVPGWQARGGYGDGGTPRMVGRARRRPPAGPCHPGHCCQSGF
ncbi:glycosyltransferase [Arthrobacter sp. Hz1]